MLLPVTVILGGRITYSWTYSIWTWQHGGKRKFVKAVRAAAQAELAEADYEVYDLTPIRCLIGDSGSRFCRMLAAEDAAAMGQRMNGMEADLAMLDKKLKRFYGLRASTSLSGGGRGATVLSGEFRYRIGGASRYRVHVATSVPNGHKLKQLKLKTFWNCPRAAAYGITRVCHFVF